MTKNQKRMGHAIVLVLAGVISLIKVYFAPETAPYNNTQDTTQNIKSGAHVERVVDGDTLKVIDQGQEKTIRLIGINSPESVDPRRSVECFGKEASAYIRSLAEDKDVEISLDTSQGEFDKYGRVLAYVFLTDGTSLNKKMIEDGYAFEYTYHIPYLYQQEFKDAEKDARTHKRGLWDTKVCQYK